MVIFQPAVLTLTLTNGIIYLQEFLKYKNKDIILNVSILNKP